MQMMRDNHEKSLHNLHLNPAKFIERIRGSISDEANKPRRNPKNAGDEIGAGIGRTTLRRFEVTKHLRTGRGDQGLVSLVWIGDQPP